MKKALFRNPRSSRRCHGESGVTMVLVAIAMVAIIGIAALSIDVITLYLAREEAQRVADAAALAAAQVISVSGMTGDPSNSSSSWNAICGGSSSPATQAAVAVATQSAVGGIVASTPTVTYSTSGGSGTDCSSLGPAFGVNPMVTVKVQRTSLPTFFSRIWGKTSSTVSASATAEAFNPSASDVNNNGLSGVTPVQPACIKPLMIPNENPNSPPVNGSGYCNTLTRGRPCDPFVAVADGAIQQPGVQPTNPNGVIGDTFTLFADCAAGSPCAPQPTGTPPQANQALGTFNGFGAPSPPNLQYVPGAAPPFSVAVPSCAASGGGGVPEFQPAVAGCDQNTKYWCGTTGGLNTIDLSENPGGPAPGGDTASALACLLVNDATSDPPQTQLDTLDMTVYPYKIKAGPKNPTGLAAGTVITTSNSIISLPIYDTSVPLTFTGNQANVTIVGFLQVFVNQIGADGSITVTVLNVAGCGNGTSIPNNPVIGNSPVPVRLITPP